MSPTNDNDDLGNLIGRELHNRVDDLHEAPLTFRDVQGRATRIRRGRRIAAGVGLAAAAAILVPTALIAGSGLDGSKQPDPAPQPSTSTATATEGSPGVKPTVPLDVSGLETGEPPAVTWLDGQTAHLASGETLELAGAYQSIAEVGDRFVVSGVDDQGNRQATVLSEAGEPSGSFPISDYSGVVTNGKGTAAAWIGNDGVPMVLQEGQPEPVQLTAVEGSGFGIGGLAGDNCMPASDSGGPTEAADSGCTVYVNSGSDIGQRTSWVVTSQGAVGRTGGGLLAVNAVDPDGSRLMGLTELKDPLGGCWNVTDRDFQAEWETCDDQPEAFSPNGQYIATVPAETEGYGPTELAILEAEGGDRVVRFVLDQNAQATPSHIVWEDAEHVLAVVFQNDQWSVVRFGLDGSMEYAVEPLSGNSDAYRLVLAR